jgi:uncharacterized membrane protein YfcA
MELTNNTLVLMLLAGLVIGVVGGMLGIGGGVLVIPVLVFLFHFKHDLAIGTSLGMLLPPIGIFAFLTYYRAGLVNVHAAGALAVGFAFGAYFGGRLVTGGHVPEKTLRLLFGLLLIYVAAQMILRNDKRVWAATVTTVMLVFSAVTYVVLRLLGRQMEKKFSARDTFLASMEQPFEPDYEI